MPDFISLTCPTCGGQLQITPDIDRFACTHCGNEHLARRGAGIVTLAPVIDSMDALRRATDRTASELAIRRHKDEIAELASLRSKVEARLVPLEAKIAEHNNWRRHVRSMPLLLILGVLAGLGFLLVNAQPLPGDYASTGTQPLAIVLFLTAVVFLLLWAVPLVFLYTVYAIRPPRREVEAAIQAVQAEIQSIDNARLAKQAELQQLLRLVQPPS